MKPELIVMLTYNDRTAANAPEIFAQCRNSPAAWWGFKEEGLPPEQMRALFSEMRRCGKKTALEVVAYTEAECLAGARAAADCGCDLLMGTVFSDAILDFCKAHGLRYLPFVGTVTERPSVLEGTLEQMIAQAEAYLAKGAWGIDLLGYRYTGDADALIRAFVERVPAPVCVAGSVNSFDRLDHLKQAAPWALTIGSAFFDGCFGDGFPEQIDRVCAYLEDDEAAEDVQS